MLSVLPLAEMLICLVLVLHQDFPLTIYRVLFYQIFLLTLHKKMVM
jgi:hypothetical protein